MCDAARGGVFTPATSKSWKPLNAWQLGLEYLGYGGNGDYAQELVSVQRAVAGGSLSMPDVAVAAINTTSYYQGLFGLGIAKGAFEDGKAVETPMTRAGIASRSIPSVTPSRGA